MLGLFRLITALVLLGVVVGCTESVQEIDERKLGCAEWTDEGGGRCLRTFQGMYDNAARTRREMKPPSGGNTTGVGVSDLPSVYGDLDCDDFSSRAGAQAYLESHPADADYLDGDGDGVACEWPS